MDIFRSGRVWVLFWGGLQGLALLLLHDGVKELANPSAQFVWIWPCYTIALFLPLTLKMLADYRFNPGFWRLVPVLAAFLAAISAYQGWAVYTGPVEYVYWDSRLAITSLTVVACWMILLPFLQYRLRHGIWRADYNSLFTDAWRNVLQLASAGVFTLVFWMLLMLWAGLFEILKIHFFWELFLNHRFIYPVTAVAFGLGVALYQVKESVIFSMCCASLAILGWLLPLVSLICLLFAAMLPVVGLEPLWKTGHATALMLWLQVLEIFLFNAAWQNGNAMKWPGWLKAGVGFALLTLPVYSVLCAYALFLRINQYGWSVSRVWAVLLVLVMACYALGYIYAVSRRATPWMAQVARINVGMAVLTVVLLAAVSSPLLNPSRIAVSSQVARLLHGKVTPERFDYNYLRFQAGRVGNEALQQLAKSSQYPNAPNVRELAGKALALSAPYSSPAMSPVWDARSLVARFKVYPAGMQPEEKFVAFLVNEANSAPYRQSCFSAHSPQSCTLLKLDLNADGAEEYLLFSGLYDSALYGQSGGQWQYIGGLALAAPVANFPGTESDLQAAIAAGKVQVVQPQWRELEIGQTRFSVQER